MGDRGNIFVVQDFDNEEETCEGVYFYAHWAGSGLPEIVKSALSRKARWGDYSYLARILFCELVKGDIEGSTGYGIALRVQDNEHPIVRVDPFQQVVDFVREKDAETYGPTEYSWPFSEYIEMSDDDLNEIYHEVARW